MKDRPLIYLILYDDDECVAEIFWEYQDAEAWVAEEKKFGRYNYSIKPWEVQ